MNVLSLFDGMSCGRIALERAGIHVDKYYASEVDEKAIQVSKNNYPDIKQVGDVNQLQGERHIDLLIGGSPCQGFSFAGEGLNFNDPRSQLFFEFVRLLKECKPKHFLLENVKMKKEHQDVISKFLRVEPIEINSSLVSAQDRKRLYWTNIKKVKQPKDKGIKLSDVVSKDRDWFPLLPWCQKVWGGKKKVDTLRTLDADKSFCLTTNKTHSRNYYLNTERTLMTKLNAAEAEILQTVPSGYTDCVPEGHRFKMLGNGWTVDVITHIMKGLK